MAQSGAASNCGSLIFCSNIVLYKGMLTSELSGSKFIRRINGNLNELADNSSNPYFSSKPSPKKSFNEISIAFKTLIKLLKRRSWPFSYRPY